MPSTVNIHEAKTHLSKLLEKVEKGEEFIIARAGKPVAMLTAVRGKTNPKRKPGFAVGLLSEAEVQSLLDPALDKEIEEMFYAEGPSPDESRNR